MPTCQECGQSFPTWVKIEGRFRNLQNRRYCLDCSPFGDRKKRGKSSPLWEMPRRKFVRLIRRCSTFGEVLSHFGLPNVGSNPRTLKTRLEAEGLHAEIQRLREGGRRYRRPGTPLKALLVKDSSFSRYHLKRRLVAEGILEEVCAVCGLGPEWNGEPLTLVLDHKNGVRNDHRLQNLRLLCPNCNSQTDTFAGRNGRSSVS